MKTITTPEMLGCIFVGILGIFLLNEFGRIVWEAFRPAAKEMQLWHKEKKQASFWDCFWEALEEEPLTVEAFQLNSKVLLECMQIISAMDGDWLWLLEICQKKIGRNRDAVEEIYRDIQRSRDKDLGIKRQ